MAAKLRTPPRAIAQALPPRVATLDDAQRAVDALTAPDTREPSFRVPRDSLTVDLVTGRNRVRHRLGRRPIAVIVTPTVADAAFAYAAILDGTDGNARPDVEAWITVVGPAQPGAAVLLM